MAKLYKGINGPASGRVGGSRWWLWKSLSLILIFSNLYSLSLNAQTLKGSHQHKLQSTLRDKVQQIYTSQIGIREKLPNSGLAVDQYLRYVNLPKGNPWCAAFVCWVYGKAGIVNPRSGWSPALFREGRIVWERGAKKEPGTKSHESRLPTHVPRGYPNSLTTTNQQLTIPSTGDIFGLYFPEKARIAHVGFIDQWDGIWLVTVEGNTNVSGSREGDGVYRKRRLVRSVYMVARYLE